MMRTTKETFSDNGVVGYYASLEGLQGAESYFFNKYMRDGLRILDIGVGAGRTVERLSRSAGRYVGIDYSANMIAECRRKYPDREFHVLDAADMGLFETGSFDICVFSFNGIDYLHPDAQRVRFLQECRRLLSPGGLFIFSVHNARRAICWPLLQGVSPLKGIWRIARAALVSLQLACRCVSYRAFWSGSGYVFDPVHDGLFTHMATPEGVAGELTRSGFDILDILGCHHPIRMPRIAVPWFYYVARKRD